MTKTIIAGVDGSKPAHEAALTAARIARAFGATLHVVSAFDTHHDRAASEAGFDPALAAERVSAAEAQKLVEAYPGLSVVSVAEAGKPADTLVRLAEVLEADLIVVGNRRLKGLGRLLGSIASEVASKAPCDVYVAHTHD